jgi:hypothetical protein
MRFKLESFHRDIPDEELLDDLRSVYDSLTQQGVSMSFRSYSDCGKYAPSTIADRFGSWNAALEKAGIPITEEKDVSEEQLFKNLESVWTALGRQPVTRDMTKSLSKYPFQLYASKYGTWRKALERFVEYVGEADPQPDMPKGPQRAGKKSTAKRRTTRSISDRIRFRILMRDGFSCQSCGRSPTKERGVELHVDHIRPWPKGGETVEKNLQTKCSRCNLGKGNAFDK